MFLMGPKDTGGKGSDCFLFQSWCIHSLPVTIYQLFQII